MSRDFNFLSFPLSGSQLIEASAGTGKTFSLALLYTRLVLGHGRDGSAFHRPLNPREILVVTFTDAAAEELRDRIRARLVEAAACFQAPAHSGSEATADPLLEELKADFGEDQWPLCGWRLQMAAEMMDEASISTIHSWCNRMLTEHAFDTRGLFNRELVTDQTELLAEVVRDYWRKHFYRLSPEEAELVQTCFRSPESLRERLQNLLGACHHGLTYRGARLEISDLSDHLAYWTRKAAIEQTARQQWADELQDIEQHLWELRPGLNGSKHDSSQEEKFGNLLASFRDWAREGGEAPRKLQYFAEGRFHFKKGREQRVSSFAAFATLNTLFSLDEQERDLRGSEPGIDLESAIVAHAQDWVRKHFSRHMQQRAQMGFDDLLIQLDEALQDAGHGPALARALANAFPAAMIDEFQDTDPLQYRIFDQIYQLERNQAEQLLVMIGDPKQAIYSFRGADIHTYLRARSATGDRHYTLKRNFRSTAGVVAACNHLFGHAEQHPRGAFRFQRPAGGNPVPYVVVDARGQQEQLLFCGQPAAAMTLWPFAPDEGEALAKTSYQQQAAELAASEVLRWLTLARQGQAGFGPAAKAQAQVERALKPGDIAILVRTGAEARLMRKQLSLRNIASVYLSDSESVFASAEARDLLHWLRACAEPGDERLVRAALGTNTLDLPVAQLSAWREDELGWEQQMQRFADLRRVWLRQGALALIRQLLDHYHLPARLLGKPDGERRLTNILHLAEWLQQASVTVPGEQALIRHLCEHIEAGDEQQLTRLESDADLVQVITIHKSKGLEYPLVLLPFIGGWRGISARTSQVSWRGDAAGAGISHIELAGKSSFPEAWEEAEDERISEDMRLLYVALTRASHGLWLGVGPLKSGNAKKPQIECSALGYLLNGGARLDRAEDVMAAYRQLAAGCQHIELLADLPPVSDQQLAAPPGPALQPARSPSQLQRLKPWWVSSYSAISYGAVDQIAADHLLPEPQQPPEIESPLEATASESRDEPQERAPAPDELTPDRLMHQFPSGASWGTFLHGLLEWAAMQRYQPGDGAVLRGFRATSEATEARDQRLRRLCQLRGIEHLAGPLSGWLEQFLRLPWPLATATNSRAESDLALVNLHPTAFAVEMEFLIESQDVGTRQLDALVSRNTLGRRARPAALPNQLNGMLKGFIDLVVEHEGRYYVVDWKSNKLGVDDRAYSHSAMADAVLAKRYDLQYCLYLLALHRQLRARLPDYDYEQHIGGAVYVFLRGWQSASRGCFFDRPPRALIEQMDALFEGRTAGQTVGPASSDGTFSGEQGVLF